MRVRGKSFTEELKKKGIIVCIESFDEDIIKQVFKDINDSSKSAKIINFDFTPNQEQFEKIFEIAKDLEFFKEERNEYFTLDSMSAYFTKKEPLSISSLEDVVKARKQPKVYQKFNPINGRV